MSKKIHINIGGMSCTHCQDVIENGLKSLKGVKRASADYVKETADVEYDERVISEEKIFKKIEKLGYSVLAQKESGPVDFSNIIATLAVIFVLFYLLNHFGILNILAPGNVANAGMGYGMLFVIGLLTSVHCIAMCGGIGLSQSLSGNGKSFASPVAYNLGRVVSYTAIGFILGLVGLIIGGGTSIGIPYMFQGILKILAGLMMVIMGINMLGIIPGLRRFTIRPPKAITRLIGSKRKNAAGPFAVGLLNGFMPCGPLQSMWIVALASADPFKGAISMLLFSLGTVPLMLGFGSFATMLSKKFSRQVMKAGAVLVVVLGLSMISQGGALSGINLSARGTEQIVSTQENSPEIAQNPAADDIETPVAGSSADTEVQEIYSTISAGYYPDITVKAGVPVRWVINAPEGSLTGCNYRMIIPAYGIEHTFDYGENVIEFTPDKSGVVGYSCWMGMIRAQIYVEENE